MYVHHLASLRCNLPQTCCLEARASISWKKASVVQSHRAKAQAIRRLLAGYLLAAAKQVGGAKQLRMATQLAGGPGVPDPAALQDVGCGGKAEGDGGELLDQ